MKEFSARAKQAFTGRQGGATVYSRLDLEEDALGDSLLTSSGDGGGRASDPGGRFGTGGGHVYVGAGDYAGGGEWQGHTAGHGDGEGGAIDLGSMVPTPEEELLLTSQLAKEAAELLWEFLALGSAEVRDADIDAHLSALLANARVLQAQMRGHISNYVGGHEAGLAQALEASDMLTTCLQEYESSNSRAEPLERQEPPSAGYQPPPPLAEPLPAPAMVAAATTASPFPSLAAPPPPAAPSPPPAVPQANLLGLEGTGLEELVAPAPSQGPGVGAGAPGGAPTLSPGDSLL